jgi:primosomal protein N'
VCKDTNDRAWRIDMKPFFTITEIAVLCGIVLPAVSVCRAQDNPERDSNSTTIGTVSVSESTSPEEQELLEHLTDEGIVERDQETGQLNVRISSLKQLQKLGVVKEHESSAGTDTGGIGGY